MITALFLLVLLCVGLAAVLCVAWCALADADGESAWLRTECGYLLARCGLLEGQNATLRAELERLRAGVGLLGSARPPCQCDGDDGLNDMVGF